MKIAKSNWNLANAITVSRLFFCVAFSYVSYMYPGWHRVLLAILGLIFLSDGIDGPVARNFSGVSEIGASMDRAFDKVFYLSAFFFLLFSPEIHLSVKITSFPLVVIESMLLWTLYKGIQRKADVSAKSAGKRKMILECVAITLCVLGILAKDYLGAEYSNFHLHVVVIQNLVFVVATYLGVMSYRGHLAINNLQHNQ